MKRRGFIVERNTQIVGPFDNEPDATNAIPNGSTVLPTEYYFIDQWGDLTRAE